MIVFDTPYKAEDVGYNEERFAVLNAHFEKMINDGKLQAASFVPFTRNG